MNRTLATFGWSTWGDAIDRLGDVAAVWLGPSGVAQVGSLTVAGKMPVTTRIHAWSSDGATLWRLIPRSGAGTVLVTGLAESWGSPGQPLATRPVTAQVTTDDGWARTWLVQASPVMFLAPTNLGTQDPDRG